MNLLPDKLRCPSIAVFAALTCLIAGPVLAVDMPNVPLSLQQNVPPLVMLVSGKDHRLFYEAYNDVSDLDGDGLLDIRFKPRMNYLGLFQSAYCYTYSASRFEPAGKAVDGKCPRSWSGNWLNYVTTSRIDALRVVLYGGMRQVDTATATVLRRAYIPQDGHSWAKEYTSEAVDGYKISDYTPLAQPEYEKRHFFGNVTQAIGKDCANLNLCSDAAPWLSVVTNSTVRVWDWASSENPVLNDQNHRGSARSNYIVDVAVCTPHDQKECRQYGESWKPIGLLQEYGENGSMHFGLLTGSYDNSVAGGRLRKIVSSFANEVDPATGQFTNIAGIVSTYNALRIRDFNHSVKVQNTYRGERILNRAPNPGEVADWGNPIGEMMYEAVRYFAGTGSPTPAFMGSDTVDNHVGLPRATWNNPYAAAPYCARANMLVISEPNVSYDSDQLPGSYFNSGFSGDLSTFNALSEANRISSNEPDIKGQHFIGQSGTSFDHAPTAKKVESLGAVRGLAPDEPTKQGSYYAASVASYAHRTDVNPAHGTQTVKTVVLALPPSTPRIEVPLSTGRRIAVVPFAKSIADPSDRINSTKGHFQPTNQIVDFYVDSIMNTSAADRDPNVNDGRYSAKFRINYEDIEQGGDHDMDVIVEYELKLLRNDVLEVIVRPTYQFGKVRHRIGYVISGTTKDGVYLEVQDEEDKLSYFLNTPPGMAPGDCDKSDPAPACVLLPHYVDGAKVQMRAKREFFPSTQTAATYLKDPLWYAAKWGGFTDRDKNDLPTIESEWDSTGGGSGGDGDGVPDAYVLANNPAKLKQAMRSALENIASGTSSASNVAVNSTSGGKAGLMFQATFDSRKWSGDLSAFAVGPQGLVPSPKWMASKRIPPWRERKIFVRTSERRAVRWLDHSALPTPDKKYMTAQVSDYLRGDTSREIRALPGSSGNLRERDGVLGDIIHSSPAHDAATRTVYVGANDGMLHAFSAEDGTETFAVAPQQAFQRIAALSKVAYNHQYFVDGEVVIAPPSDLTGQRRLLFSLLGRGGRGLFALDVTTPANFSEADFLWEYTDAEGATRLDDLGLMVSRPVVVKLNNNKLGLLAGNGYNSNNGRAALFIFVIEKNGTLSDTVVLDTKEGHDNGLSGPAAVDVDGNGTVDLVYAGDLKGNVWKFDLSSPSWSDWKVGGSIFMATDVEGTRQPITAPMYAARKPPDPSGKDPHAGGWFVFFGTGSYMRQGDQLDLSVQSWYGLNISQTNIDRGSLRKRTIDGSGVVGGMRVRTFSKAATGDMTRVKGWYVDLVDPGERIIGASRIVDASVTALLASSIYPAPGEVCIPGGHGYINFIDPFTGASLGNGLIDVDGNGQADDKLGDRVFGSIDPGIGMVTEPTIIDLGSGGKLIATGGSGAPPKRSNDPADPTGSNVGRDSGDGGTSRVGIGGLDSAVGFHSPGGNKVGRFKGRLAWREIVKD